MTKTEILETIAKQTEQQEKVILMMGEIIKMPNVGADAVAITSILGTINATIFDTMTTVARILCEMLPEPTPEKAPEPKRGTHGKRCKTGFFPECQCLTCARDHGHGEDDTRSCCAEHYKLCSGTCPDYVKEDPA